MALEFFKEEIKKGLGYLVIVIGISFVIRGCVFASFRFLLTPSSYGQWKRQKEAQIGEVQILLPQSNLATSTPQRVSYPEESSENTIPLSSRDSHEYAGESIEVSFFLPVVTPTDLRERKQ